jgi:hypothetical protein
MNNIETAVPHPATFQVQRHPPTVLLLGCIVLVYLGQFIMISWLAHIIIGHAAAAIVVLPFTMLYSQFLLEKTIVAEIEITTDQHGLLINVTRPGLKIKTGQVSYLWSDMKEYRWYRGDSGKSLVLWIDFKDKSRHNFIERRDSNSLKTFGTYLDTYFPKKKWRFWG